MMSSPRKRKRRRTLQSSQSDEENERKKKKARKSPPKAKRTPNPLKLTEASNESTNSSSPKRENSNPNIEDEQKKKKKAKGIRDFFKPCSAADYFSQFNDEVNHKNMKKQTAAAKKLQKKCCDNISQNKEEPNADTKMENNKPLKKRKKTPSPKKQKKKEPEPMRLDSPSPALNELSKLSLQKESNPSNQNNKSDENPSAKKVTGKKRKLNEISNDATNQNEQSTDPNPPKKAKRKFYPGYKRQDVPPLAGKTEIPTGKPMCLSGMRFVITGQLPSITRDECKDLIQEYGGRVTGSVSGMTRYLIAGEDAGESKLKKAKEKKVTVIDEAKFLDLLRTLPPGKGAKNASKVSSKASSRRQSTTKSKTNTNSNSVTPMPMMNGSAGDQLLVDKYKPTTSRDLIGNNKCIQSLREHLMNWDRIKNVDSKKGRNAVKKGVLLSGQPGIGKSSAISVIANELGFKVVEFNASDTRSKKGLRNVVEQSLNNKTMTDFFGVHKVSKNKNKKQEKKNDDFKLLNKKSKNLIIMDEVDGMSSGDRGGMQELVGYIQKSKVPIICICNDRTSQKMRTLSNYCVDLRFRKPTVQQISKRLYKIARNEGFICDQPTINKIAEGTNGDIRQMLHLLQFWSNGGNKNLSFRDVKERMGQSAKDLTMGPWDVAPKLFYSNTSILDGITYYFVDYSLIPLMIQENYLSISNQRSSKWSLNQLKSLICASQSICDGDLIDTNIKKSQQYSALPYHGVLSSLKPGKYASQCGRISGRIAFPQWLGKFSSRNKSDRCFGEVATNMNSSHLAGGITGSIVTLEYMQVLKQKVVKPLMENGKDAIDDVVEFMKMYKISRTDWDSISEMGRFDGKKKSDKSGNVPTRVKTAFTKKCTAELGTNVVKKGKKASLNDVRIKNEEDEEDGGEEEEEEAEDDIANDKLIKETKKRKTTKRKKKK